MSKWTKQEDEFLTAKFRAGETYEAIAEAISRKFSKRTKDSCIGRGKRLGFEIRPSLYVRNEGYIWTPEEDRFLADNISLGKTYREVADLLTENFKARSKSAVHNRANKLGIKCLPERKERKFHNDGKIVKPRQLVVLTGEGITIHELKKDSCRYITNDIEKLYCGQTSMDNSPYCECHHKVCYVETSVYKMKFVPK